jgi:hypothetical protein
VKFEHSFQGQKDGEIIVNKKNATFHEAPLRLVERHYAAAVTARC